MRVLILGDLHGRHDALPDILRNARRDLGVVSCIQVGDFGWTAKAISKLSRLPMPVFAIDGNHDDHNFLAAARKKRHPRLWAANLDLHFIARGRTLELGGVPIGMLGGALHAHQAQVKRPANFVTDTDVQVALKAWRTRKPSVIITHSCPAGIGIGMLADSKMSASVELHCRQAGFDPGPDTDCGEPGLSVLWKAMEWRPQAWCFGHFHQVHQWTVDGTDFTCVGSGDGTDGSPAVRPVILDLGDAKRPRVIAKLGITI